MSGMTEEMTLPAGHPGLGQRPSRGGRRRPGEADVEYGRQEIFDLQQRQPPLVWLKVAGAEQEWS